MASSVRATRSSAPGPAVRIGKHAADARTTAPVSHHALAALVKDEVIPRLMLAHRADTVDVALSSAGFGPFDLEAFVPLTLECDASDLLTHMDGLIDGGATVETIMIDVLAPAARRLGEWWVEDRCDFVDVTMGLWRLQEVVRSLSARIPPTPDTDYRRPRRALFAAFPGEQHDFGTIMVGELFHRSGWEVETMIGCDMADLLGEVARCHYDIVGLTVSCDCHRSRIPSAILAVRSVSRNPQVRVMIGGRLFVEDPALAATVGADGTAADARQALAVAAALVDAVEREVIHCS